MWKGSFCNHQTFAYLRILMHLKYAKAKTLLLAYALPVSFEVDERICFHDLIRKSDKSILGFMP